MDAACTVNLAARIKIGKDRLVREEYQILILKELYESEFGSALVLKNGAALRLAYHSARFADDLDFNLINDLDEKKFVAFLEKLTRRYPGFEVVKTTKSYQIFQVQLKIKVDHLFRPLSLKLEIYQQVKNWVKGRNYQDKMIRSETVPLTVLVQVAGLEEIVAEKEILLRRKKSARDVYDYWFVSQLLQKETRVDFSGFDKVQARTELHKLLAKPHWPLMDSWIE